MIFERRAYTLRPGRLEAFWEAQARWNTEAVFGPILERNVGYFSALSGRRDQVVHLYRFASLDQWRSLYSAYYDAQSPDYFALVRPWMLRQENAFLGPPPDATLASLWTGDALLLPPALEAPPDPECACVVETITDLLPGGLPRFWQAVGEHGPEIDCFCRHRAAVLAALAGRLHRVFRYEVFASETDALRHAEARDADPRWQSFARSTAEWVVDETTALLRPAPLASRRALLDGRARDGSREPAPPSP